MKIKNKILIGYSGHGYVVADLALENNYKLLGYTEIFRMKNNPFNLEYLGNERDKNFQFWEMDIDFLIGIGDNGIREKVFSFVRSKGKNVSTLIHPTSSVSKFVTIGSGVFINRNVSINTFVKVGDNVLLNTGCIIEHECVISDSVHICPGAVLAGNVKIGDRTLIGANSVIKQGVSIGKDVTIGAGSVVLKDIPDGATFVGNPARLI